MAIRGVALGVLATVLWHPHGVSAERTRPAQPPPPAPTPAPAPRARCNLHAGEVFDGRYTCHQGETDLRLEVLDVRGTEVRAAFDFHWAAGNITGRFTLRGRCDPATGRWTLDPEAWQRRPAGWVMVGMDGTLDEGGASYRGQIVDSSCGGFAVHRP